MPKFGTVSLARLSTCENDLQSLFYRVIEVFDCTVLCGHRGEKEQNEVFRAGASEKPWPLGMHNSVPSKAVDVAPYNDAKKPVDWDDIMRFYLFAGYVLGLAADMGIAIRWGGDWNRNTRVNDQKFNELVHFERVRGA